MYCLSVSHKTSNVVVRKKLAFPDEQKKTFLDELYYSENISECLILCTCNRTEVYFCGDESSVKTVETVLSDFSGIDFDELKKYICLFYGDRALLHLFRVAGGIDSMVIGEDEILGQLKRAYAFAKDNGTVAYELNMCVQAAVACADHAARGAVTLEDCRNQIALTFQVSGHDGGHHELASQRCRRNARELV